MTPLGPSRPLPLPTSTTAPSSWGPRRGGGVAALLQAPGASADPGLREDASLLRLCVSGGLCWPRGPPKDRSILLLVFSKTPEASCPRASLSLRTFAKPAGLSTSLTGPDQTHRVAGGRLPSHPTFPQRVRSVLRVWAWLPMTVYFSSPICAHGRHRTRHQHAEQSQSTFVG